MGKIDKSKAYHQKYIRGYLEPTESSIRALTMLRYQNEKKEYENRNYKSYEYKIAASSSAGYVRRIKEILCQDEDLYLNLGMYNYDEVFKVKTLPSVHEMDIRDLPSPTNKIESNSNNKIRTNEVNQRMSMELPPKSPMMNQQHNASATQVALNNYILYSRN